MVDDLADPYTRTFLTSKKEELMKKVKLFKVPVHIPEEDIQSLLISAFENSGISYWVSAIAPIKKSIGRVRSKSWYSAVMKHGFTLVEQDEYGKSKVRSVPASRFPKGLQLMAKDQPQHFADILTGNADADTADVFVQLLVFGEIVYG